MDVKSAIRYGTEYGVSADVLAFLREALGVDTAYLFAHGERELTAAEQVRFEEMLGLSGGGMPSAYVLGYKEFMSLRFNVNRHVLIPRPETELLTEKIINRLKKIKKPKILDIGTGSGCIAVSLAHYLPQSEVTALDVSPEALLAAAGNAALNGVEKRVGFVRLDILKDMDELEGNEYDVIVSNPPYIESAMVEKLDKSVYEFEPRSALDGGTDGIEFYPALKSAALRFIRPGGFLAMEISFDQADKVREIFADMNGSFQIENDYSGIARFAFIDL